MARPNIVAAIAKLVFLHMGASDSWGRQEDQQLSQNEGYGTLEKAVVLPETRAASKLPP
jgi:hypothetical protein